MMNREQSVVIVMMFCCLLFGKVSVMMVMFKGVFWMLVFSVMVCVLCGCSFKVWVNRQLMVMLKMLSMMVIKQVFGVVVIRNCQLCGIQEIVMKVMNISVSIELKNLVIVFVLVFIFWSVMLMVIGISRIISVVMMFFFGILRFSVEVQINSISGIRMILKMVEVMVIRIDSVRLFLEKQVKMLEVVLLGMQEMISRLMVIGFGRLRKMVIRKLMNGMKLYCEMMLMLRLQGWCRVR